MINPNNIRIINEGREAYLNGYELDDPFVNLYVKDKTSFEYLLFQKGWKETELDIEEGFFD